MVLTRSKSSLTQQQSTDRVNITVFGATGFTGKFIVQEIFRLQHEHNISTAFKWAIAGRSKERLDSIAEAMAAKYPKTTMPQVVIADVSNRESIDIMARTSQVIINAVGPFRFLGEYVVRSCVENFCDYVDITGEPEFIERMQRTYHDQAVKSGITIVHACGFDSIPTDLGVLWTKNLYVEDNQMPTQMEMFFKLKTGPSGLRGNYATYESAVHGVSSVELLREIRKSSNLAPLPRPVGPKLKFHKWYNWDDELQAYVVPFVFADPSVVKLSQRLFLTGYGVTPSASKKALPPTVQFAAYTILPSLLVVIIYYMVLIIFGSLSSTPWGRSLLLKYPEFFSYGLFSRNGPTDQQLQETSFEVTLRAKGYSNKAPPAPGAQPNVEITTKVHGPEPGYVATPRMVVQAALALLEGKQKRDVPVGVLTPSVAFWQTDLIDRLQKVGIEFEQI
ncbi:saccharopine dehydrogenase [Umbelopsis sp. AD052]|nr:saccharopine dehydrogenase [Umbelopsis sp. AD052]